MIARTALAVALTCACMIPAGHALAAGKEKRANASNGEGGIAGAGIPPLTTIRVASGMTRPIYATHAPGDATRLFIIEKQGRIRVLKIDQNPPVLLGTSFLDIDAIITGGTSTGSEQGLLGLDFHPNYQSNGYFFVYYTANGGANTIARYQVSGNPDVANAGSGTVLLAIPDTESNHNGGWIGFKPGDTNGYLYISTGDGGGANDQHGTIGNGQNLTQIGGGTNVHALFGKILRIDIDGADGIPGNDDDDGILGNGSTGGYTNPPTNPFFGATPGLDEIWAYGLRNAWRPSFDRLTGDMYIADVGQNAWEEISFEPSNSPGGRNYGWRCMEGNHCTGLSGCTCEINCGSNVLVCPIWEYAHGGVPFKCSITGGYVYRGAAIPELHGTYFFADYNCGQPGNAPIFSFTYTGGMVTNFMDRTAELAPGGGLTVDSITSFGEDLAGEIYICDQDGGEVFKIIQQAPVNDNCAVASLISEGTTSFSTNAATTDGPDETGGCGVGQIHNDIWYRFLSPCDGTATISVCGASFDTRLAAYGPCPTGSGQTLACNDNACGSASEISFPVVMGTFYRVRLGSASAGVTGTGSLVFTCTSGPNCPSDIDDSGTTDIDDLLLVINNWGAGAGNPADVDNDNDVDIDDLLLVINGWGPCV